VAVRLNVPLIPRYAPVPEPATIGAGADTVMLPEHVPSFFRFQASRVRNWAAPTATRIAA
jgi:hypothetical protein